MISDQARRTIDEVFARSVRATLAMDRGADRLEVTPLESAALMVPGPSKRLVVLTIASYLFRLTTVFALPDDRSTRSYFSRGNREEALDEIFSELGNLCCGAMNRELGGHFPHLGMSTPVVLDAGCLSFIDALKAQHVVSHNVRINDAVALTATLCLRAYGPLDFRVNAQDVAEAGVLELM